MALPTFTAARAHGSGGARGGRCGAASATAKAILAVPDVSPLLNHPVLRLALVPVPILHAGITAAPCTRLASESRVPKPPVLVGKAFSLGR